MPFDEGLAARLDGIIRERFSGSGLTETRIFGGFGYMLNGNMCFGIHRDTLILRIGAEQAEKILSEPHVRPMDLTGRVMKGWVMLEPEAITEDEDLERYCQLAIAFVATLPVKP